MTQPHYDYISASRITRPTIFDLTAIVIIAGVLCILGWSASLMVTPYELGDQIVLKFEWQYLIFYGLRTLLRLILAMILSIIVTFSVGSLMAKNARYRQILLPIIDILQSIPPLGVNAFIILSCIKLFPGSIFGLELAAIITTFFSQVWNMILSFYQSIITIPKELEEASQIFGLSPWKRFWKLEVPQATPGLIINSMVSMSASWFFVVASESLSLADQQIVLPGVGSFLAWAILNKNLHAVGAAFITMLAIILIYDQLFFRPLMTWSEKFKDEILEDEEYQTSWFFDVLSRAHFLHHSWVMISEKIDRWSRMSQKKWQQKVLSPKSQHLREMIRKLLHLMEPPLFLACAFWCAYSALSFLTGFPITDLLHVLKLGAVTATKVMITVLISAIIWIPVGVMIGNHRKLAVKFQPIIQFLAACPPQLVYPFFAELIIEQHYNVEIWTAPIMILGTQWYVLFNVIAGSLMITKDQRLVAANFGLNSFLLWRRLYLPAVLPYCITGCMAAAGGCWNVSIDSDTITWGSDQVQATGISSYIHEALSKGNFDEATLGIMVMTFYVILINRWLWNPLFQKVSSYYQ